MESTDDLPLAGGQQGVVEGYVFGGDAEGAAVADQGEVVSGLQKELGGDAASVETDAADLVSFDEG